MQGVWGFGVLGFWLQNKKRTKEYFCCYDGHAALSPKTQNPKTPI